MRGLSILVLSLLVAILTAPSGSGSDRLLAVPPLQGQIASESDRTGKTDIFLMESDGTDLRKLIGVRQHDWQVTWAPDGTEIMFASSRGGDFDIYVANADGTDARNLTRHPARDVQPSWSPDGTTVVFRSNRSGDEELWAMDADGSNPRQLTDYPRSENKPTWSTDSRFILFHGFRDLPELDIFIMRRDGADQRRWTNTLRADHTASWHPKLPRVAYHSHEGDPRGGKIFVARVDADGNILSTKQITMNRSNIGDTFPDWSPEGSKIVFTSDRVPGNKDIYVMEADGSNITRLTDDPGLDCCAQWSPRPQRSRNGSFEWDSDRDGLPDNWEGINLEPGDGLTDIDPKVGLYSMELHGDPSLPKELRQKLLLHGNEGETLTLAGWGKSVGLLPDGLYQVAGSPVPPGRHSDQLQDNAPQERPVVDVSKGNLRSPKGIYEHTAEA